MDKRQALIEELVEQLRPYIFVGNKASKYPIFATLANFILAREQKLLHIIERNRISMQRCDDRQHIKRHDGDIYECEEALTSIDGGREIK